VKRPPSASVWIEAKKFGKYYTGGDCMSYVAPEMKSRFETLSIDLKNEILKRDVRICTLGDLIKVFEEIASEG